MATDKAVLRKKRWQMVAVNAMALIGAAALFVLLGFVNKKNHSIRCWKLDIAISHPSDHSFFDEDFIRKQVLASCDSLIGASLSSIHIDTIHHTLSNIAGVKDANVFTTADGRCMVEITERNPIVRVINSGGSSFYIDADGFTMPLSSRFTAHVPVFVGNINEHQLSKSVLELQQDSVWKKTSILDDIFYFTNVIRNHEFWNAQVEHVHVNSAREFEIIPRVGNHRLLMGKAEHLELKLKKLQTFYANTLNVYDLNDFSTINVKFDEQVVCVKK